ncbi:MAG: hypothetical protein DRO12_05535 [Thermoprotei archaeon]|nr:MAG: hypothetical protein DRO12_05535 [Thermoprotei archaeon]
MQEAVIVGNDNPNAVISVDDLIMKIGLLVVENMQKDRVLNNVMKRLAELEERQIKNKNEKSEELRKYKEQYDALSKRYNTVVEEVSSLRKQLSEAIERIKILENENYKLREELERKKTKKRKQ